MSGRPAARPLPDAAAAFRADPRWRGGDDAYSVVLPDGRRLWLFGDTFVARAGGHRRDASFIHNSVAVQAAGSDLAPGALTFRWREGPDGPSSFLPDRADGSYLWPGDAAVVDGRLVLFAMVTHDRPAEEVDRTVETLTFFASDDWTALLVEDPSGDPLGWELVELERPAVPFAPLVGSAGVVVHDGFLHAHTVDYPAAHVCRWPVEDVVRGDLSSPRWWVAGHGWVPTDELTGPPTVTIADGETEFTVHRLDDGRFLQVQMSGLDDPRFLLRTADAPQGPWSVPVAVAHRPVDAGRDDRFCYAGKAHPGLGRGGLVLTHNAIPLTLDAIREHTDLYWPRVVEVDVGAV